MSHSNSVANPGPLGLLGFGMTTFLLNLHNAGITELSVAILSMGIALGGLAQVIAGIMEFKAGNTFGATAFTSYGLFWWSLVIILVNPACLGGLEASGTTMGFYMLLWGIYTSFMFVGTLKGDRSLQLVFLTLAILFFILAVEKFTGSHALAKVAGIEGMICAAIAMYTSFATVVNTQFGKKVLPL
ncbi:MAG: acetate uptake transporter [Firmicutes bacterium]|nr:acetate uptake transporter [Bacillota bacterium]MBQ4091763.1 acetate uptake transporter [Bacillota bacterium]MBQ6809791.1 acetate uptake transporter [Bacillota bacterium]